VFPEAVSTFGPSIDGLYKAILGITGFFFFLVQGLLLFFLIRYRASRHPKAAYVHGNTGLEIVWTVIPALILVVLTIGSQRVWTQIRSPENFPKTGAVEAEILAEQFAWNVRYAGADGRMNTEDDVATINQLHLPVGKPVKLTLRSKDVIHSFFVPEFRVKQDAVPGLDSAVWMKLIKTGQFDIRCAELCGLGHYRMRGYATVESPEQFEAWLKEAKANE